MKKATEKLRKLVFWTIDFIKGSKVRKHYNDIKFILENYDSKESKDRRGLHLSRLLKHASSTTAFYKDFSNFSSLNDFPVINKTTIRKKIEEIQSDIYKDKKNYKMSTSGSSGTPFTTLQNKNKRLRNTADTIYFKQQAGFEIGYRLYYIRKWFKMHQKSRTTTQLRNIVMVDVTEFSDDYLSQFIAELRSDSSTKVIIGYSSALREICKYLDKTNARPIKSDISCIIAMAESLSTNTRKSLEKYFNAPVLIRYSNLENGILSLQLPHSGNCLQINWASYYIEILHLQKDEPVGFGEMGRVIVTDLFNYCMPIIRYDTGDFAIMTNKDPYFNSAPSFSHVEGRKMDMIYDTSGNAKSTFIIFHLESYPDLKQFQFIQESRTLYTLKLNTEGTFSSENELVQMFKDYLGQDATINVNYVNEIPQLSSGKRRLTINNYRQEQ